LEFQVIGAIRLEPFDPEFGGGFGQARSDSEITRRPLRSARFRKRIRPAEVVTERGSVSRRTIAKFRRPEFIPIPNHSFSFQDREVVFSFQKVVGPRKRFTG
jgi:hypothetical protein